MLLTANAESGTNGAQLVAGGDFNLVNNGSTGSTTYDNGVAISGMMSYKTTQGTNNTYVAWFTALGGTKTELWLRMYASVASFSGSGVGIAHFRYSGGLAGRVGLTNTGKVNIVSGANTILQTSTTILSVNTPFRIEMHGVASASPTGGTLEVRIFTNRENTVADEVLGPFRTTQTAAGFDQVWFGVTGSPGFVMSYDDVAVSDTDWVGPSGSPTSPPSVTTAPTISGTVVVGSMLTSSTGTWSGSTPITYTYQWQRCDSSGNNPVAIGGATNSTYIITSADIGYTLRAAVTATNSYGNDTSDTSPTIVVSNPAAAVQLNNNFDGTNGVAVTTGNSGGTHGDAFDSVTTSSGTLAYDTSQKVSGAASMYITSTGSGAYVSWAASYTAATSVFTRMYVRFASYPTSGVRVQRFSYQGTTAVGVYVASNGLVRIRDASGTSLAAGTSALPLNQWVRIEINVNASTSAGSASVQVYIQPDATTPTETVSTATNLALTAAIGQIDTGIVAVPSSGDALWIDELGISDSWLGPVARLAPRWGWGMVAVPGLFRSPTPPDSPGDSATIYGVDCDLSTWAGEPNVDYATRGAWFGRIPCGRGWHVGSLPTTGNFTYGGKEWGMSGGTYSEKRVQVNFDFSSLNSDYANRLATGDYDARLISYIQSVPTDWKEYLCFQSEYNLHITGTNTVAHYIAAHQHLGALIEQYATNGNVVPVICISSAGFSASQAPAANTMPSNTLFLIDAYGNPNGTKGPDNNTYKNYASPYPSPASVVDASYAAVVNTLGYANWGIGEFNAPQRVAPVLSSYDSLMGWGPHSTNDLSGVARAQWIKDYCDYLQTKPVPPKMVLLWEGGNGTWNQLFTSYGSLRTYGKTCDDRLDSGGNRVTPLTTSYQASYTPGTHNQSWPIATSTTVRDRLINAYKPYFTNSP